jgi:hypothetical protein
MVVSKRVCLAIISVVGLITSFQNCSKVSFVPTPDALASLGVCNKISCDLTPLTKDPAVTTILMALGEQYNSQLEVSGASSQFISETVVRYSSPKSNPKILMVQDSNTSGENPEDTVYAKDVLLSRYNVTAITIPDSGLTSADVEGYDLIWFNNPGYPMGSATTRDTLLAFAGGVVIQGDDLSHGQDFDLETLTGLHYVDNGTDVICNGTSYHHDDSMGEQYRVSLIPEKFTGVSSSVIDFRYGNDIDNTTVARPDLEVLATALGGPADCVEQRPAIVRYVKTVSP